MKKNELKKWRDNYTPCADNFVCLAEGIRLNIHFDEKEYVKDLGAQWHQKGGYWWMPVRQLSRQPSSYVPSVVNIFERGESDTGGHSNGITILKWLNDNKMISDEWHGNLDKDSCDEVCIGETPKDYYLCTMVASMKFEFYDDLQIVRFTTKESHGNPSSGPTTRETSTWNKVDDARTLWDSLVDVGAERVPMT